MDILSGDDPNVFRRDDHGNIIFYDPSTEPFLRTDEMYALIAFLIGFAFVIAAAFLHSAVPHTKARMGARFALCFAASFALAQPLELDRYFPYGLNAHGLLIIFGLFSVTYAAATLLEWANGIFRR